jgi:tRNA(adenine34) deaminase
MSTAGRWESAMQLALREADFAAADGDVPVGAVVLDEGDRVIAFGRNRREVDGDPTAHAEIVAIRAAATTIGHWRLEGCTLVVTLEPCAMCAGAIVSARVPRVVFGAVDPKAGATRSLFTIADDARLNHRAEIIAGILAEESSTRLRSFFARLRAEGQK